MAESGFLISWASTAGARSSVRSRSSSSLPPCPASEIVMTFQPALPCIGEQLRLTMWSFPAAVRVSPRAISWLSVVRTASATRSGRIAMISNSLSSRIRRTLRPRSSSAAGLASRTRPSGSTSNTAKTIPAIWSDADGASITQRAASGTARRTAPVHQAQQVLGR